MKSLRTMMAVIAIVVAPSLSASEPSFPDFPVQAHVDGTPAPPRLATASAKRFRMRLREAAAQGPNFAGDFTLARWGCGASCIQWAVIDARDGRVWMAPFTVSASSFGTKPDCGPSIEFRRDSELVVITGARNERGSGQHFYRWQNGRLTPFETSRR